MTSLGTTDYLDRVESMWSESLRRASLAAEVIAAPDFKPQHVSTTLTALGRVARKHSSSSHLAEWPAALVIAMTYRALEDYQQGAFWETFAASFTERRETWASDDNTLWGDAYLKSLRKLGLPTFETTRRYVGNIVLHAGVPSYCFPDLLQVLAKAMRGVGPDGPASVSWLRARTETSTFANIDTPVRDFIVNGDVYAADFVARAVELLDRLQNGEETEGVGLAARYVEAARDYVATLTSPLPGRRGTASRTRPTVTLDPGSGRLLLDLPAVPGGQGMRWHISVDGDNFEVKPATAWATDHGAAATAWDVPRPAQQLVVRANHDVGTSFTLELVSERTPYLLFNEDGTQILADAPLSNVPMWVLRLDEGAGVETDGTATVVAQGAFPLGWSDWTLELVDLQDASFFAIGRAPRRRVTTRTRARFLLGGASPGLAANGTPVFAARPRVDLPPDVPEGAWTVSVKDIQTGSFLASPPDPRRPLDHLAAPLVGAFEIAVRGPLARGTRARVAIVEDLHVSTSPAFRTFSEQGLEPSEVAFSAAVGVTFSTQTLDLGKDEAAASVVVSGARARLDLLCTPPSMAVSLEAAGHHTTWQHRPLRLPSDAFSSARILLRLPPNAKGLVPLQVQSSSGVHQHVDSSRQGDSSTAIYSLEKAADTVSDLGAGRLVVGIPSGDVLIASFRPAALASSASSQGAWVHVDGLASSDVEATTWALYAPWLGAQTCRVAGSRFAVPDQLVGQGPLVFNLRIADPWTSEEPPTTPIGRDLFLVDAAIDASADPLTKYLGGADTRRGADFDPGKVMAQLSFSSPLAAARLCRLHPWQVEELTRASQPDKRLAALVALHITRPRRPHLVVLSGMATERFSPNRHVPERQLVEGLTFNPLESSLRNLHLLADPEAPTRMTELWRQAEQTLGVSVLDILCGLEDPHRSAPTFDPNAAALHAMATALRDLVVAGAKFLPSSVTDPDARAVAALQLLTSIGDGRLTSVTSQTPTIIAAADHLLRRSGFEREADAVRAREDPAASTWWMSLPAASLALALAARLGARGHGQLRELALAHQERWSALSAVARKLTEIDLVLAEAYAVSASRTTHPTRDRRPDLRDEAGTA